MSNACSSPRIQSLFLCCNLQNSSPLSVIEHQIGERHRLRGRDVSTEVCSAIAIDDDGQGEGNNGDRLYNKTLNEIQRVPEDEGYRKAVERFTRHRLKVCQEEEDWEAIKKRLGCGQVEELIEEAQDELKLIDKMIRAG